jgi:hypothetical protein
MSWAQLNQSTPNRLSAKAISISWANMCSKLVVETLVHVLPIDLWDSFLVQLCEAHLDEKIQEIQNTLNQQQSISLFFNPSVFIK